MRERERGVGRGSDKIHLLLLFVSVVDVLSSLDRNSRE